MVNFWKYFFYRNLWWEKRGSEWNKQSNSIFAAILGVSGTMAFNFYVLFYYIKHKFNIIDENNIICYSIVTLIIAANGIYFSRKEKIKEILIEVDEMSKRGKMLYDIMCILYIIITFWLLWI
jgi:membrane protein insertase Oxa1/YidC/SpoIIIJ